MQFSLGLGLTNECNLACPHCYRDVNGLQRLSLAQVRAILARLPVRSVNLGTGENGLHPEFPAIVETLQAAGVKVSLTSNGYSVGVLPDALVKGFHEVVLGDLTEQSLEEIWRGEKHRRFRERLRSDDPHPCCRTCGVGWSL